MIADRLCGLEIITDRLVGHICEHYQLDFDNFYDSEVNTKRYRMARLTLYWVLHEYFGVATRNIMEVLNGNDYLIRASAKVKSMECFPQIQETSFMLIAKIL